MINISVIVPIYNVAPFIEKCVRSLMEQTYKDVEYIFVNDCTLDNSIEILERVIVDYPNRLEQVRIIHNERNLGLAATRFEGMKVAQGGYIYHCDSDDWVELEMLETMYNSAIAIDADMVFCEAVKETQSGPQRYTIDYDEETQENGLLNMNLSEIHVAIWNKLVKRNLYDTYSIEYFPGINMGEDSALTVRLRYFSKKTIVVHSPFYHYNRMNINSMCAVCSEKSIGQQKALAQEIEKFFISVGKEKQYIRVIDFYKFMSKQSILRCEKDYKRWYSIFPESHKSIILFTNLSLKGRILWWICAHFYYPLKWILK